MRALSVSVFALVSMCAACDRPSGINSRDRSGGVAMGFISELIKDQSVLSSVRRAYILEETISEGRLGPNARRAFMRLDIKPSSLSKWSALIEPLKREDANMFVTPRLKSDWWPAQSPLPGARIVGSPTILRGSLRGWVAISATGDRLYLYSYAI